MLWRSRILRDLRFMCSLVERFALNLQPSRAELRIAGLAHNSSAFSSASVRRVLQLWQRATKSGKDAGEKATTDCELSKGLAKGEPSNEANCWLQCIFCFCFFQFFPLALLAITRRRLEPRVHGRDGEPASRPGRGECEPRLDMEELFVHCLARKRLNEWAAIKAIASRRFPRACARELQIKTRDIAQI